MKSQKHSFLRRVISLCLGMMSWITVMTVGMYAISGAPADAATVGVLMGGWCGELLLALLKRKWEQEDKRDENGEGGDSQ